MWPDIKGGIIPYFHLGYVTKIKICPLTSASFQQITLFDVFENLITLKIVKNLSQKLVKVYELAKIFLILKAYYYKKVGLIDLSTYGGKIKFEIWLSRQRWAGRPNSNFILLPRHLTRGRCLQLYSTFPQHKSK